MKQVNKMIIPLAIYLLAGLLTISFGVTQIYGITINPLHFAIWGIVGAVMEGAREHFHNRIVNAGIAIYMAAVMVWMIYTTSATVRLHGAFIIMGFAGIFIISYLTSKKLVAIVVGYLAAIGLIVLTINGYEASKVITALTIFLMLNGVSDTISLVKGNKKSALIVIYVVVAMLTFAMPVKDEPYDWAFVTRIVDVAKEMYDRISYEVTSFIDRFDDNNIFRFGMTGYNDKNGNMSNSIIESSIEQLSVNGRRTRRGLYLRGNVNNVYMGNHWDNDITEVVMEDEIDFLMTMYAVFDYSDDLQELRKFIEVYEEEIIFRNIRTSSYFYPLKTINITAENTTNANDIIRRNETVPRGTTYEVSFVDLDYSSPEIREILEKCDDITYTKDKYNRVYELLEEYYGVVPQKIEYEDFIRKVETQQENVYKVYTQVSEYTSEAVRELAASLGENGVSSFNKCLDMENYLYNYTYNQNIDIPSDANVLDWFLFESKTGYCMHYASALCEMLKSEGIPARFVEGFLVDYSKATDFSHNDVPASAAHAWVEAYIDGFGWIRLEATVVNAVKSNRPWVLQQNEVNAAEEEIEDIDSSNELVVEENSQEESAYVMILGFIGGMAAVVILIVVILVIDRQRRIKKSRDPDVIFEVVMDKWARLYGKKEEGATLREYIDSILCKTEDEELRKTFIQILKLYEGYWYGDHIISSEEIDFLKKCTNKQKELRQEVGNDN